MAFYAYSAARDHVTSATKSLKDAEDVEGAAEDRYKQGIGTVVEVAQTRQAVAEARLAQVQAEGSAEDTYLTLMSTMGISPTTKLKVQDISRRKLSTGMREQVDKIVSAALARRTDVLTAYAGLQASLANSACCGSRVFSQIISHGDRHPYIGRS